VLRLVPRRCPGRPPAAPRMAAPAAPAGLSPHPGWDLGTAAVCRAMEPGAPPPPATGMAAPLPAQAVAADACEGGGGGEGEGWRENTELGRGGKSVLVSAGEDPKAPPPFLAVPPPSRWGAPCAGVWGPAAPASLAFGVLVTGPSLAFCPGAAPPGRMAPAPGARSTAPGGGCGRAPAGRPSGHTEIVRPRRRGPPPSYLPPPSPRWHDRAVPPFIENRHSRIIPGDVGKSFCFK